MILFIKLFYRIQKISIKIWHGRGEGFGQKVLFEHRNHICNKTRNILKINIYLTLIKWKNTIISKTIVKFDDCACEGRRASNFVERGFPLLIL